MVTPALTQKVAARSLAPGTRRILTIGSLLLLALIVAYMEQPSFSSYYRRIVNVAFIYVVAAVSYNLINGIAGQFSLGPNGFMAIGGFTTTLLMLPVARKAQVFFLEPLIWPFNSFSVPEVLHGFFARLIPHAALAAFLASNLGFLISLVGAGLVAALGGLIVGAPSLRLRGDYLAIATFGFGEIIFVLANNLIPVTNGALGIRDIPEYANLWWTAGAAVMTVWVIQNLVNSSYGRALKAIREDEVAAEAMGVHVFTHKLLAFVVHAFFAGVAGGLLAALLTTISPSLFTFFMTFQLLIIIVLGGLGSTTGAAVTAVVYAILQEVLRVVEAPMSIGPLYIPGVPGMRMVVFSGLLIVLMLFYRRGLFGRAELTWEGLQAVALGLGRRFGASPRERGR
ncbi:branched-chain amino acid ABC transporter permease [Carboxydochorda subterranea]|uniref:Branched-chain amino acid ABC transporter permease n=1 Tax=Carboxydichorda subterranea TaxID=3109565 RepID=A0ABZ1BWK2_9FIRM|nr:branched-chain amino acid ABC transporter permease [Limnochorda sp. L945t]WRP16507.1 branched-chain amino acid ABC transporter permease [Limnochorda sp. L945t]